MAQTLKHVMIIPKFSIMGKEIIYYKYMYYTEVKIPLCN